MSEGGIDLTVLRENAEWFRGRSKTVPVEVGTVLALVELAEATMVLDPADLASADRLYKAVTKFVLPEGAIMPKPKRKRKPKVEEAADGG